MKLSTPRCLGLFFLLIISTVACTPADDFSADAPPTSIAAAAGDRLWSSEELVGSSPEVRMVVSPNKGDIEYISDVVSLAWKRDGWRVKTSTDSGLVTITGHLEGTEYTAELQPCSDELPGCQVVEERPAVFVHVWKSGGK